MKLTRTLMALWLFGIAFGYVEAAVVVYLRTLLDPMRERAFAAVEHDEVFPLLLPTQPLADYPRYALVAATELGRELATLAMLAAIGLALGDHPHRWLAGFLIAFGIWDIFYYVFLRVLLGWPASLWTWDILFLWPVPWVGPVVAPLIVSASMIAAGTALLRREAQGRPICFHWLHWAAICGGGLIIVVAFCWDWRHILDGGTPRGFHWPLFVGGETLGVAGFLSAARRSRVQ